MEGRYIVRLQLGQSRNKAVARLVGMELKFKKNKQLEGEYRSFMEEYAKLGHLKPRQGRKANEGEEYYLPHHAVIKEDSTTTRLRVVFDASARSSSGISLNEKLLTGPILQQDLFSIILRWRTHRIAYKADIEKMYRQIQIAEDDQNFQLILWRNSPQESIKEYQLTTVTYGTRSAPYLAVKTLLQLAKDERKNYPIASTIAGRDFYVDDLIAGADSIKEAKEAQGQLINMLESGGFKLHKWASHCPEILADLPQDSIETKPFQISDQAEDSIKALGIQWHPKTDCFRFNINLSQTVGRPTKRTMLSEASRLFDPLGWLTPITIKAKTMLQDLWLEGLNWDDPLPEPMAKRWVEYKTHLSVIDNFKISRWIHHSKDTNAQEIHGFCDASEKAYAAVVYYKTIDQNGQIKISLLGAKSKVAPLKKSISLPRLELCAAVLLTRLLKKIKEAMELNDITTYAWTDSTVTLSWIKGDASKWKTFVANRVTLIQRTVNPNHWHHVKSGENPADVASRGTNPKQLLMHPLWWTGPEWLKQNTLQLTQVPTERTTLEARKIKVMASVLLQTTLLTELCAKYSSLLKLVRVVAYCRRFILHAKLSAQAHLRTKYPISNQRKKDHGPITPEEAHVAKSMLIKAVQQEEFPNDINRILKKKQLKSDSKILPLNPFLDSEHVLRVGGRLANTNLPMDQKHPIILPHKHPLTSLIIREAHDRTLHGGIQLTLAHTRLQYWIIKGQSAVKQHVQKCVICCRQNAKTTNQLMGNLPEARTAIVRPFTNIGVDYAGPLQIRMSNGRGAKSQKGYIVIFICLTTKAMHLEAATDLSAEAFLAAFRRLVGRRGSVQNIYSDNATNFVLANKILELNTKAFKSAYHDKIVLECANLGTTWHFIPPSAPNFGGLWEAGVKSVKNHLKRILGDTRLTYEGLTTVLIQIEACLNSRPLCPLSSDPQELEVLTPGHFLVGSALLAPPGRDLTDKNISLQNNWQLLQKLYQDFWKRWSAEYLTRLQERPKWLQKTVNLQSGQIVIIKEDNLPPTRWALARIVEIHPGKDGLVRVATLKTRKGMIKRPVSKLCLLPVDKENCNKLQSMVLSMKNTSKPEGIQELPSSVLNSKANVSNKIQSQPAPTRPSPSPNQIPKHPKSIDYDVLLSKAYKEAKKGHKGARVTQVTAYSNLITKEKQDEAFEHLRKRYPITASQMEQRKRRANNTSQHSAKLIKQQGTSSTNASSPTMKNSTFSNSLLLLFFALLLVPILATSQGPVTLTPFQENPGLYFEEIGRVSIINSQWNIIAFYDISNYITEINGIRETVVSLERLCNLTTVRKRFCLEILHQFQHELRQIEESHQLLTHLNGNIHSRDKRSPLDIVGNIANKLFGVLDAEYADKMNQEIEKTRENEGQLLNLIKNQTSFIESTINILKKQDITIQNQFQIIKNHITSLTELIEEAGRAMKEEQTAHLIAALSAHTILIIHNCQRVQDMILDVLTDIHHGKANPLILTPPQLKKQIIIIKDHLPRTLTLPGNGQGQLLLLYSLMTIRGRVLPSRILFQIKIPLLLNKEFQLFKLFPIPTPHVKNFIFIDPSSEYLAVGEHRESHFPMTQREVDSCTNIGDGRYLCQDNHPIFNQESRTSQCELQLLNHQKELSSSCKIQTTAPSKFWIQLHTPNSWLYSLDEEYTFSTICGAAITSQTINGTGILKLRPDCSIKQPSMLIHGQGRYESQYNASFLPKTNLSQQLLDITVTRKWNKPVPNLHVNNTQGEIASLIKKLNQFRMKEALPQQLTVHDIHQYSMIYVVLAILLILGVIYIIKRHRQRQTTKTKPIPAKRKKLSDDDFCVDTSTP